MYVVEFAQLRGYVNLNVNVLLSAYSLYCLQFGEIDIDGSLVAAKTAGAEDIMMLNNGCLCCTVRGDLVRMISELVAKKKGKFDHIVIETTGNCQTLFLFNIDMIDLPVSCYGCAQCDRLVLLFVLNRFGKSCTNNPDLLCRGKYF